MFCGFSSIRWKRLHRSKSLAHHVWLEKQVLLQTGEYSWDQLSILIDICSWWWCNECCAFCISCTMTKSKWSLASVIEVNLLVALMSTLTILAATYDQASTLRFQQTIYLDQACVHTLACTDFRISYSRVCTFEVRCSMSWLADWELLKSLNSLAMSSLIRHVSDA